MIRSSSPLRRRGLMLAGAASLLARPSFAQGWRPSGPIRLIAGAAAGGTLDIHARAAAPLLAERLGQPVVVENNGGGGGRVAAATVGRAAPDGHTLLVASGDGLVIADLLFTDRSGPLRPRLRPVMLTVSASQLLVTHPTSGIESVADYVTAARRPGGVTLALPGHGGIAHLISEMLNREVGLPRVVHVPYRGGGPAALDLLAGQLDAMIITLPAVTDYVRAGRLRPLAVTGKTRDPAMPEVPTLDETIAPGFDMTSTQGVLAPAATPDAVIEALHGAWRAALLTPVVGRRLGDLGFVVTASTPAEFQSSMDTTGARFGQTIAAAGIRGEDA
ncbi:Bug family tripartite tricarboxylate transporter substrate binding protein [Muricoccus radiodurans]|uniref:Bug family tripartite tricarboxylate transporter substrate binding protein n=1 Tax=Muricoccus radiodurans TaxID=2231721 RepID=UPI003CF8EBE1